MSSGHEKWNRYAGGVAFRSCSLQMQATIAANGNNTLSVKSDFFKDFQTEITKTYVSFKISIYFCLEGCFFDI